MGIAKDCQKTANGSLGLVDGSSRIVYGPLSAFKNRKGSFKSVNELLRIAKALVKIVKDALEVAQGSLRVAKARLRIVEGSLETAKGRAIIV